MFHFLVILNCNSSSTIPCFNFFLNFLPPPGTESNFTTLYPHWIKWQDYEVKGNDSRIIKLLVATNSPVRC